MINKKIFLIVIVGPTASGKSELAVRIAKKIHGEVISADSRQIYKNLTIGTAKVDGRWTKRGFMYKNIPHFCIDMVPVKKTYTAAVFKKCAQNAIFDISLRGKIPIIVGGTGLWIDALVYDLNLPEVAPNQNVRKKLEKKSTDELFAILKKLDSRRAARIEQKNPRRLVRAIEIATVLGRVPLIKKKNPYNAHWIGLAPDERVLCKRIIARSRTMVRSGLMRETEKLLAKGVSKKRIRELGFEYAAALNTIEKKILPQELADILARETIAYAKRQMRWFTRNKDITWFASSAQAYTHANTF